MVSNPVERAASCGLALLALVLLAGSVSAASAYRMPDSFYQVSESVVTPHIAWAKPYHTGKLKALIIAPRWTQRETIELAQRLSLDHTTCMTWGPRRFGGQVDGPIYRRAQGAMAEDVAADILGKLKRDYDVIVVGNVDWRILPREVEYAILKRVHDGTGLVCANHAAGHTKTLDRILALKPVRDDAGFVSRGVPLKALPALGLRDRGGEGIGDIIALRRLKRGRVAFLGFPERAQTESGRLRMLKPKLPRFTFLTPAMGFVGERELLHYEYYLSLGIKTMLWAAGKEPAVHIESIGPDDVTLKRDELAGTSVTIATRADRALQSVTVRFVVRDELNKEEHEAKKSLNLQQGRSTITFPAPSLKAGRHFVDAFIEKDGKIVNWGSSCFDVRTDVFVREVALEKASYETAEEVRGKVVLSQSGGNAFKVRLSVADTLGRVAWTDTLETAAREIPFAFRLKHPLAIVQNVRARLMKGDDVIAEARKEFSVRLRNWDDYSFMIWGYDFGPYSPTEYWLLRQLRSWGVDTISNCAPHPELARGIALANLHAIPYATRYAVGKGQTDLVRRPCLTDPAWREGERERLVERAHSFAPYGPFAYSLGDENFLGHNGVDICFSETCQADFGKYLQRRYGSLQDLNEEYGTRYEAWEQIRPTTLPDARKDGMFPLWADHRMHMEEVFVGAHRAATHAIKGVDSAARVGFDGPAFWLSWSWSGMNWWEFAKFFELLNLYAQHPVGLEIVRSFAKKGTIVCSWYGGYFYANRCGSGWQRNEDMQRFYPWWMAFHGATSTSWFNSWGSAPENAVAPDLSAYPCFQWAIEEASELKAGVGKLLMNAERLHDGIAIHYSQASAHASTIDHSLTSIAKSHRNFLLALEDLGLQYEFMSYEQIESGALLKERWRVLVLPYSQAVSEKEAEGTRDFVRRGGLVIADLAPGVMDEHCKRLPAGLLDDVFGVRHGATAVRETGEALISGTVDGVRFEGVIPDAVADGSLVVSTARALAKIKDASAVVLNQFDNGKAVLLNLALDRYETLRKEGHGTPVKNLLRRALELGGVRSRIGLSTEAGELKGCETVFFRDGPIEYVGLLRSHVVKAPVSVQARVAFPKRAYVYDVRAQRLLGLTDRAETSMRTWRAQLYALLPYRVDDLALTPDRRNCQQGDVVTLTATLSTSPGKAGTHCIRVTAFGPDGAPRPHYSQNVLTKDGEAIGEVPLALNDQPGRWRFVAEDVVSGTKEAVEVELKRRADVALTEGPDEKIPSIRELPPRTASAGLPLPAARSRVGVRVGELSRRPVGYGPLKGKTYRARPISFGGTPFSLRWMDVMDEHGEHRGYEEGYIGMPGPSAQNWYHGGYLFLFVNGRDLGSVPVSDVGVVEQGARGSACIIWETPEATVQTRFLVLAGDDRLFVEIALTPKTEIKSLRVETVCYPSLFTSARKMPGRRHVISPAKEAWQGQPFRIDPAKDSWLLYADDVHDVAKGSGVGPCAMAFLPEQVQGGSISIGSYPVRTELDIKPDVRRIRLVFWDLNGMANADALAKMRQDAPTACSYLEKMDFTIRAVTALDVSKRRSEIDDLIRTCRGERKFTPIFEPLFERLAEVQARLLKQKQAGELIDPAVERELAELLGKLAETEQDLRSYALLHD